MPNIHTYIHAQCFKNPLPVDVCMYAKLVCMYAKLVCMLGHLEVPKAGYWAADRPHGMKPV